MKDNSIYEFLSDQGSFVQDILQELKEEVSNDCPGFRLIFSIGEFAVHTIDGILSIQAEWDSQNRVSLEEFPPILSHQLVKLRGKGFIDIVSRHRTHLA